MRKLIALIGSLALSLAPASAWRMGTTDQTVLDKSFYTVGSYGLFLNPQNPQGLNWWEYASVRPSAFPNKTRTQWNWPLRASPNVLAFLDVFSFGDYFNTVPQTPITAKQVSAITTLTATANLTHSGTTNGYSVLYDYFLTASANSHGSNGGLYEVELFLHSPQYAIDYINAGFVTQIGTTTISGITWQVAVDSTAFSGTQPIFLIVQSNYADVPAGTTIDLKAIHAYLIAQGYAIGSTFWGGLGGGVEVGQGTGSLTVNSVSVTYN
jgi:hypothetical protein